MKIVESIIKMLTGKEEITLASVQEVPEGTCPNCWGRDEYSGAFYNAAKAQGLNGNNIGAHVGWVQEYANKNFSKIAIVSDGDSLGCKNCNMKG